jgi:hypothetical protein
MSTTATRPWLAQIVLKVGVYCTFDVPAFVFSKTGIGLGKIKPAINYPHVAGAMDSGEIVCRDQI